MEFAAITRALRTRWLLTLLVILAATGAAAALKVTKHTVPTGTATAQLMVDSPQSVIADLRQDTIPLTTRASVFAQFMASSLIEQRIAAVMGVPAGEITTEGPFSGPGQSLNAVTPSEARGPQLAAQRKLYRLTLVAQDQLPIVTVSAQAPTPALAGKLADSVYPAVSGYLHDLQRASAPPSGDIPVRNRVTLRQLGPSQEGTENSRGALVLMVAAFAGVLMLGLLAVLVLEKARPKRARKLLRKNKKNAAAEEAVTDDEVMDLVGMANNHPFHYDLAGAGSRDVDSPRSPSPIR